MSNPQDILRATAGIYRDAIVSACRDLFRNWPIVIGSVGIYFIYTISASLLSEFGFAGGMVAGMIQIALLSLYYAWISQSVERERLSFANLIEFDVGLFFNVISVAFILFIAQFVLQQLTQGLDATFLILCVQLAIVLIFNAIPEVVHLHRIESMPALSEAARFTRDNWIEWYAPFLLLISPWLILNPLSVLLAISGSNPLLPPLLIIQGATVVGFYWSPPMQWGLVIIAIVVANWLMLFRAHLFKALESGTRRQRAYRAKSR